ncbi:MAG: glutathione S-transferase family protein [Lysobacter sp.]|nr:glutathione S-transferase family protein [Lysobacter sp.]
MSNVLFIGDKNYSSWSLRPWLVLRWAGIPFEERVLRLDQPGYGRQEIAEVKAVAPNGTVPALHADGPMDRLVIWDSLAIAEWAAEQVAPGVLWPEDAALRAQARSATCEMHSGFAAVRRDLSMNIRRRMERAPEWPEDTRRQLARLDALWSDLRERHAHLGPWLFGTRSIADAFFAPVATRLRTYAVEGSGIATAYRDTVLADADFLAWQAGCVDDRGEASGHPVVDGLYR